MENSFPASPHIAKKESAEQQKLSVLIVEDDQFLRDLMVTKFASEGFVVIQAVNGEEAIQKFKDGAPSVVLLDLVVSGMDGFEILRRLQNDKEAPKIPIIVLSNLSQEGDIERAKQLGAEEYLIKAHFTPTEIVEKVKELLRKRY